MDRSKDAVARDLAEAHYSAEPGMVRIVRLVSAGAKESASDEPVKLLEVNQNTTADGIRPIYFGAHPAQGITYSSVIVEVTPAEFDQIRRDPRLLPNGWRLGEEFPRTPAAAVGA